jgi:hypothetical protein
MQRVFLSFLVGIWRSALARHAHTPRDREEIVYLIRLRALPLSTPRDFNLGAAGVRRPHPPQLLLKITHLRTKQLSHFTSLLTTFNVSIQTLNRKCLIIHGLGDTAHEK